MSAAGWPMKRLVWWSLQKSIDKRHKVKKVGFLVLAVKYISPA